MFLLAAVFAGISLCCSSFTSNAVVAFLISVFACIIFYFGFTAISSLPVFKGKWDYYIEMLGIDFHYRSISRGVLDSRDLLYFASIVFLALTITVKKYFKKIMSNKKNTIAKKLWLPLLLVLLFVINWAASKWHTRIDFTNEKRFTLSQSTKQLLQSIKEPVKIDVFLKGNYQSGFTKLAATTQKPYRSLKKFRATTCSTILFRPTILLKEQKLPGA